VPENARAFYTSEKIRKNLRHLIAKKTGTLTLEKGRANSKTYT
jgi:hypothetical protein